jgi:hypothetical protein
MEEEIMIGLWLELSEGFSKPCPGWTSLKRSRLRGDTLSDPQCEKKAHAKDSNLISGKAWTKKELFFH